MKAASGICRNPHTQRACHRRATREVSMTDDLPRRKFLLGAGLAGTAIAAGISEHSEAQPQPAADVPAVAALPAADSEPFVTLTATEAAFFVAAVDTLIPADELSPSGSDCGVAIFIDRQLGSAWGGGAKMYRSGPFHKGKPEQGYQPPAAASVLDRPPCRRAHAGADSRWRRDRRAGVGRAIDGGWTTFSAGACRSTKLVIVASRLG